MNGPPLIPELAEEGLLLQAAVKIFDLGDATRSALAEVGVELSDFRSLVLLAQAGSMFWDRQVVNNLHLDDPFDDRAMAVVESWFESTHPHASWQVVYPGPASLPLGQLATRVGWGASSPLGLTINDEFGLWTAHRLAFVTDLEFVSSVAGPMFAHPCESCRDTPCVSACPVEAVSFSSGYDVESCARHRITDGSPCAHQCLARNACPVGSVHHYGTEQMTHHYGAGLGSIRDWLDES